MQRKRSLLNNTLILIMFVTIACLFSSCIARTALNKALAAGDIEKAKNLIEEGAKINQRDLSLDPQFPLHYALMMVQTEIARLLIEKGADINVRDGWGETPLHRAFISNIGSFPGKRAEKYERSPDSWFPPYYDTGGTQAEIARLLIEKGAFLNVQDNSGMTPLHCALIKNSLDWLV